jgi:hypothetical protein
MDRRDVIVGALVAAGTTVLARAQDENAKAYEICKQRGHVATVEGNLHGPYVTNSVFIGIPDRPVDAYAAESSTEWSTCWYCKKQYRYVTRIEESANGI